jgi:hypothetical protein
VRFCRIGNVAEVCHLKGRVHDVGFKRVRRGPTVRGGVHKPIRLRGCAIREVPNGGVSALGAMLSQTSGANRVEYLIRRNRIDAQASLIHPHVPQPDWDQPGRRASERQRGMNSHHGGVGPIGIREAHMHMVDDPISIMPFALGEA